MVCEFHFHLIIGIFWRLWVTIINTYALIIVFHLPFIIDVILVVRYIIISHIIYVLLIWGLIVFAHVLHLLHLHWFLVFLPIFPLAFDDSHFGVSFWLLRSGLGTSSTEYSTILWMMSFHYFLYVVWLFWFLLLYLLLFLQWKVIIIQGFKLRYCYYLLFYWVVQL